MDRLRQSLAGTPAVTERLVRGAMDTSLALIEGSARRTARKDTGQLGGSIHSIITGSGMAEMVGQVGPSARHGRWVEHGRRPGKPPPIAAIEPWARRHGVNPFVVARAIGRRRTRPAPFMVPAFRANLSRITQTFQNIGIKFVEFIARG